MRKTFIALSLMLAMLLTSVVSEAKNYELSTQLSYPPNNILYKEFYDPMTKEILEMSNGELKLQLYSPGNYVPINEEWKNLVSGMLDVGNWSTTASPKDFPWLSAILTPFMGKGTEQSTKFFWAAYETIPQIKAEIEKVGVPLLMYGPADYAFYSIKQPVRSVNDIKGKRVIVLMESDLQMVQALGATPVYLSSTDAYVGLQRGMGEILITAYPYAYSLRLHELAKYVTTMPLIYPHLFFSLNIELWNEMSDSQKQVFKSHSGLEYSLKAAKLLGQNQKTAEKAFIDAGAEMITLNDEQLAGFYSKIEPLFSSHYIPWLKGIGLENPEAVLKQLRDLSDSIE